jgi:hypothetical protein
MEEPLNQITLLLERLHEIGQPLRDLQAQLDARPEGRTLPPIPGRPAPAINITINIVQENTNDHQDH